MNTAHTLYALFIFLTVIHAQRNVPPSVLRVIKAHERIVDRLSERVTELFEKRGAFLSRCECSLHSCTNDVSEFMCTRKLGNDKETCGADCRGRLINFESSFFRTPPNTNLNRMSPRLKESICLYANLEPLMKELVTKGSPSWIYFGGVDGSMRTYPESARHRGLETGDQNLGGCRPYDPRIRPWFIGASTRPKDIVFVIDVSRSMNEPAGLFTEDTRWDVTKRAIVAMLDTLASFDFVNIVTFSDSVERLVTNTSLLRGTSSNLQQLKQKLDEVYPVGTTHFDKGLSEAFEILTSACAKDNEAPTCSRCHKVIFFLTDGHDTSMDGGQSIKPSVMLNKVEQYQRALYRETSSRATIFTFSMGEMSDDAIPRQLACANRGAWSYIDSDTDPLAAMNGYYHFLTDTSTSNSTTWINPYQDDAGLGLITTVSKPVYSKGTRNLDGVFLGVAAHDVFLSEIEQPGFPYQDVLREIINRSHECGQTPQTLCQLQVHRNAYLDNAVCPDPITSTRSGARGSSVRESPCYRGPGKFYKFISRGTSWTRALRACKGDEGRLTVVESDKELEFLAGLSSPDGSWLGAKRSSRTLRMEWIDRRASKKNLEASSKYWAVGEPNNDENREDCVSIDRRGITGNLIDANCEIELSFICEYRTSVRCNKIVKVPSRKGYFKIPPLEACVHEEENIANARPLAVARSLTRSDVMCPIGKPKNSSDVICCPDCDKD